MRKSTGLLPQMICTISSITKARPNVNKSSATWPFLCTRRKPKRSTPAPIAPASRGAISSAGQKPNHRLIWKPKKTPSMLKMTVSPLAIKNSSMPKRTPLSVDMTISSSMTQRLRSESGLRPGKYPGRMKRALEGSAGPFHLAGGRQDRFWSVNFPDAFPAPTGLFLLERFVILELAERRDVHRLEELVIVLPHEAFSAVIYVEFHALERGCDLYRIERLCLLRCKGEHPHLVHGARIKVARNVRVPRPKGLLKCLRRGVVDVREALGDLEDLIVQVGLLDRRRAAGT